MRLCGVFTSQKCLAPFATTCVKTKRANAPMRCIYIAGATTLTPRGANGARHVFGVEAPFRFWLRVIRYTGIQVYRLSGMLRYPECYRITLCRYSGIPDNRRARGYFRLVFSARG